MGENPSSFKGETLPVETVSWDNAKDFLDKLNEHVGASLFRLPYEAEWEYACRAGATSPDPFSFGDSIHSDQVNFNGNHPYGKSKISTYRRKTVPVKSLPCNAWGLYEMHGNVLEWCKDWYGDYDTTENVVSDPRGPSSGAGRVLRGGTWYGDARVCRSAYRGGLQPGIRVDGFGFRFASGHLETE